MQTFVQGGGTEGPMSSSISSQEPVSHFPRSRTAERNLIDQRRYDALAAELQASLARENVWRKEKRDLLRRLVALSLLEPSIIVYIFPISRQMLNSSNFSSACATAFRTCYSKTKPIMTS